MGKFYVFILHYMKFVFNYLQAATLIINSYDGSMPLVHHLKHYFGQHKKHGSKDRKHITHICYCYYRLGNSGKNISLENKLRIGLFLCNPKVGVWYELFDEFWLQNWTEVLEDRVDFIEQQQTDFLHGAIFSWHNKLSEGIDVAAFSLAHLQQPNLFLRIRPSFEKQVVQRLRANDIPFYTIGGNCLALANTTKIDDILQVNREVVIQDLSSQTIAQFITPELVKLNWQANWKVWDCCAASGGKSILLNDLHSNNNLLATDIRESMAHQLKDRFTLANIKNWVFEIADVSKDDMVVEENNLFDFIIADVPCTGSGTWARTPEQITYFKETSINDFAVTQKKIVSNVAKKLCKNGYFLYITCSVFKEENENIAHYIQEHLQLQLVKMELIKGYDKLADTMFAALFTKL